MAAYRRFVAYLYEYRKDKKGVNCGFVRIEAWRNVCRIELHLLCPGLVSGSECSVYGFVRKDEGIDGILLGVCETAKEEINCILESSVEHMGDSEHSLEEMGGMIITTDQGGFSEQSGMICRFGRKNSGLFREYRRIRRKVQRQMERQKLMRW